MNNLKKIFTKHSSVAGTIKFDEREIQNPAYDPNDRDIKEVENEKGEESERVGDSDFDFNIDDDLMAYQLDHLSRVEETSNLQFSSLRRGKDLGDASLAKWRKGPAPTEDKIETVGIKHASLQGMIGDYTDSAELFKHIFEMTEIESGTSDNRATDNRATDNWTTDNRATDNWTNDTASSTLINYFSYLGSTDEFGTVDYDFLDMLIKKADINAIDAFGQTVMHEVAREWNTDIARYIKLRGGRIDVPDNYGRTPLFVAVSSNHTTMVQWLIDNGADINHKTMEGEGQKPIHFAAKHAAVEAFDLLVEHGASPVEKDDKDRTPFYLSAERAQYSMCEHLLQLELPVASYSANGVSTIDHVLSKLPNKLAYTALNQFISKDLHNFKEKYYLSCLGKRRWKLLTNFQNMATTGDPPTPMEIIVERNDLDLILHPVILKYLQMMSEQFGAKYTNINILLSVLFTILWTVAITMINDKHHHFNINNTLVQLKIITTISAQLFTTYFIYKFIKEYIQSKTHCRNEQTRNLDEAKLKSTFAHPRWQIEESLLQKQIEVAGRLSVHFWADGWNYIEGLCLLMACLQTVLVIALAADPDNKTLFNVLLYYSCPFALLVWLRLNRCLRSHPTIGPFIKILAECVTAVTRFAFLFMEFYIPFTCAFWVIFGGNRNGEVTEYTYFNDLVYQLFLMAIVGDYDYDALREQYKVLAQILIFLYFILISIISLNLFIALLSEAFERVRQKAAAETYLRQAKDYIDIARENPILYRNFEMFINKKASPILIHRENKRSIGIESSRHNIEKVCKQLQILVAEIEQIQNYHKRIIQSIEVGETKFRNFYEKYSLAQFRSFTQGLLKIVNTPVYQLDKTLFQRLFDKFQQIRENNMKKVRFGGGGAEDTNIEEMEENLEFVEFEFKHLE